MLLTGVSKFSKVGVFSDLNNLNDLTMHPRYHTLAGITQAELEANFGDYLTEMALFSQQTKPALLEKIRLWYNGFCFSKRCRPVYNPFSLLRLFDAQDFQNYWFESGTPTFLLKILKTRGYDLQQLETLQLPELAFSTYEIESLEIVPLLFQTGYLTIKAYEDRFQTYTLSYPNYEVKRAFMSYLLSVYSQVELAFSSSALKHLALALLDADWERFFQVLNSFLATIDYALHTCTELVECIRQRNYFAPYLLRDKGLHLVGVNFSMEQRAVAGWVCEGATVNLSSKQ